jgi:signal transduction histidine kinase
VPGPFSRVDPARLRFWGVVLPIHVVAFAALYFATYRLLEYTYLNADAAGARHQLAQAVHEMPFMMPVTGTGLNPHLLTHLLAAHQSIGLRLYDSRGVPIGPGAPAPESAESEHVERVLARADRDAEEWIEVRDGRQWVRGAMRVSAGVGCVPCHRAGTTLGVATIRMDSTEDLNEIRRLLRPRIAVLLGFWVVLVGAVAFVVQRTVRRSYSGLDADLAAAAAGRGEPGVPPAVPLDPAAAGVYTRVRDALLRQRAREAEVVSRLAHVDQLATLGQLAAGLAHEIKNPLAGIQGALEVLKHDAPDGSTFHLYDEMLGELKRVNGILQRLLESGRAAPLRLGRTDVMRLIDETVELMKPSLRRKDVELTAETGKDLPEMNLDAAKIRQVIVNLVQNAGEALVNGGHVTVHSRVMPSGDGVVLAVEDDGPGIAREDLDRLFEPFFTTKFTGTGLGLAISKALVEQHGGRIEVDSEQGRGTTFLVFLPVSGGADAPVPGERI